MLCGRNYYSKTVVESSRNKNGKKIDIINLMLYKVLQKGSYRYLREENDMMDKTNFHLGIYSHVRLL